MKHVLTVENSRKYRVCTERTKTLISDLYLKVYWTFNELRKQMQTAKTRTLPKSPTGFLNFIPATFNGCVSAVNSCSHQGW